MRTLSQQELTAVSGAGATLPAGLAAQIDAIKKALAAKGITIALDKAAGTITITTPQARPKNPKNTRQINAFMVY